MSLSKWSADPFEEMERMLQEFSSPRVQRSSSNSSDQFIPAVDVYDEEGSVIVEAPLAGINPEDVKVSIDNGVLSIKGESEKSHEVDEDDYYRKEIRTGSFFRQISLPAQVDEESIEAEFQDGVLRITCPKKEKTGGKQIEVEAK